MSSRPAYRWWQWLLTLFLAALTCAALGVVAAIAFFGGSSCSSSVLDQHAVHVAQATIVGAGAVVVVLWGTAAVLTRGQAAVVVGLIVCAVLSLYLAGEAFFGVNWHGGLCF